MPSWTNATAPDGQRRTLPPDFPRPPTTRPGGILQPAIALRHFTIQRPPADPRLDTWLERYWTVRWDLPSGTAYESAVLTHPSVHLTVESGRGPRHGFAMPEALVHGVVTRRFSALLEGEGRVFGVKFRPGGFGAFTGLDASRLTDRVVSAADVLGAASAGFREEILRAETDEDRVEVADAF